MDERLERLIKAGYKKWQEGEPEISGHPDEESMASFLEGNLPEKESEELKSHLLICDSCLEKAAINLRLNTEKGLSVPDELLAKIKSRLVSESDSDIFLEVVLRLKEKALEIINTTGDILVGQELVPASLLRSRSVSEFKDEIIVLKDFKDIRIEVKVENKAAKSFSLVITAKYKQTQKIIKDLRVTLLKNDIELESYLTSSGSVTFEHVLLGKYKIEIAYLEDKLALVLLDVKV